MLKFDLHTYDIQRLANAVICDTTDSTMAEEDKRRLLDKLAELNSLCQEHNNYTLHVTINDNV